MSPEDRDSIGTSVEPRVGEAVIRDRNRTTLGQEGV